MNEPQRILHLVSRLDGYGGARMLRYLAASQAAAGAQVTVVASRVEVDPARELRERGVYVVTLKSRWRFDPLALGRLAKLRRRLAADATHCWDAATLLQALMTQGVASGGALATTLDAVQVGARWMPRIVQVGGQRVNAWAASDPTAERWLRRHVQHGCSELIRRGVENVERSDSHRERLRGELGVLPGEIAIVVAGPLARHKQIDEAIWFFELVRVLHDNARLLIFGEGPDRGRLERFAGEVSDPGCVRFCGYRPDFQQLLPAADMYWQLDQSPSTPFALLEAQAAGITVIASDVSAHRAAVEHEHTGLIVPVGARAELARAADRLIVDEALRRRLATAALAGVAENWSLDVAVTSYLEFYNRVLANVQA
jgi:glycosyltransferase involved in cell wall biosynthesis